MKVNEFIAFCMEHPEAINYDVVADIGDPWFHVDNLKVGKNILIIKTKEGEEEEDEIKDGPFELVVKVTSRSSERLNKLRSLFATINECCSIGASRSFDLFIDGDGSTDLSFDFSGEDDWPTLNIDDEPIEVNLE